MYTRLPPPRIRDLFPPYPTPFSPFPSNNYPRKKGSGVLSTCSLANHTQSLNLLTFCGRDYVLLGFKVAGCCGLASPVRIAGHPPTPFVLGRRSIVIHPLCTPCPGTVLSSHVPTRWIIIPIDCRRNQSSMVPSLDTSSANLRTSSTWNRSRRPSLVGLIRPWAQILLRSDLPMPRALIVSRSLRRIRISTRLRSSSAVLTDTLIYIMIAVRDGYWNWHKTNQ